MRRSLVAGLAGAAVMSTALLSGCGGSKSAVQSAQPVRRVGLMHVGIDHVPPSLKSLESRLAELGWIQGENIDLMWRNLPSEDAARVQARAFVGEHVDLIVAFEDQSVRQAIAATAKTKTPVVFLHPADPVQAGYVKSLAHPGGNVTGVFGLRDLVAKQLELYKLVDPGLRHVLALVDPVDPSTKKLLPQAEKAATQLGLTLDIRSAAGAGDLERVFRTRAAADQAVFAVSPKLLFNFSQLLIGLAEGTAHIPAELNRKEWVKKGALFSYGPDFKLIGRVGARYVDSILRGARPADLPVEEVLEVEFAVNLATAHRLGIQVPESMIIRADEVYR